MQWLIIITTTPRKMVDLYNHNQREGNGSTYFQDGARYIGGYTEVLPITISLIYVDMLPCSCYNLHFLSRIHSKEVAVFAGP